MLLKGTHAPVMTRDYALNGLTFQQQQVGFILGHSHRSPDEDLLIAPVSGNLQTPAAQFPPRIRVEARRRDELLRKQQ